MINGTTDDDGYDTVQSSWQQPMSGANHRQADHELPYYTM